MHPSIHAKSHPDKAAYISTEFNKSAADAKRTIGYIVIKQVNFDEPARDGLRKALPKREAGA